MKSKTFSGRSLRSSLKGSTWILVLLLLGFMVAFPVAELMLIGNQTDEIHRMTFAMICSYLIVPGFLVTMLAAVVNALNEFWYLFSRDKIDFYHSLPVTRSRFFWEKAIRGLVLYLVPYVIMELITMAKQIFRPPIFTQSNTPKIASSQRRKIVCLMCICRYLRYS